MVFIFVYKTEEDSIKNEDARVVTTYSVAGGEMWPKFKRIQVFMVILFTCKNDEDQLKMKALR